MLQTCYKALGTIYGIQHPQPTVTAAIAAANLQPMLFPKHTMLWKRLLDQLPHSFFCLSVCNCYGAGVRFVVYVEF